MVDRRPLATLDDFCGYVGIAAQTYYNWKWQGRDLPPVRRIGRSLRFRWDDIEKWVDAQTDRGSVA